VRSVRTALECRSTGGGRGVCRVGRRSRSRAQREHGTQSEGGAAPASANRTRGRHTVTFTTNRPIAAALTTSPFATAADQVRPLIVPGLFRRGVHIIGDLLAAVGIVLCIPFVILATGIPFVLGVRFLLWIAGML
jgi:hypothetical protein